MDSKNLYKHLEITDEEKKLRGKAFEEVCRRNWKRLSKEWHPDITKHDKTEAEEKFKSIAEAYDVLKDETKRQQYDMTGSTSGFNFSNFQDVDLNDIMKHFMGGMGGGFPGGFGFFNGFQQNQNYGGQRQYKGTDVQMKITLSINDVYTGTSKKFKYKRGVQCEHCNGGTLKTCEYCHGTGQFTKVQQMGYSTIQSVGVCPYCRGVGSSLSKSNCNHCHGEGIIKKEDIVTIDVPKGVSIGEGITMNGLGNQLPKSYNGVAGDLKVIVTNIECNDGFQIQEHHLLLYKEISILDIITGCDVEIVTPTKAKLTINIPKSSKDGAQFRLSGRGLPIHNTNRFGDMFIIIAYKFPKKLDKEELKTLDKLKKNGNFK
jgi:molecular chaperone DnaJ